MSVLRLLLPGSAVVGDLDDDRTDVLQALADLYAYPTPVPPAGWVRANMISTLDGAANGPDGLSGTIGGAADRAVFAVLRGLADVIVVGAGTVRAERYRPPRPHPEFADRRTGAGQAPAPVLAVVTRSGDLAADPVLFGPDTATLLVTCAKADVDGLRARFGEHRVVVAGEEDVDPVIAVAQLVARGWRRVLLEGGPTLLGRFASTGRLDELCLTLSPMLVAGTWSRIGHDQDPARLRLRAAHLAECDGLLFGRWLVQPS